MTQIYYKSNNHVQEANHSSVKVSVWRKKVLIVRVFIINANCTHSYKTTERLPVWSSRLTIISRRSHEIVTLRTFVFWDSFKLAVTRLCSANSRSIVVQRLQPCLGVLWFSRVTLLSRESYQIGYSKVCITTVESAIQFSAVPEVTNCKSCLFSA